MNACPDLVLFAPVAWCNSWVVDITNVDEAPVFAAYPASISVVQTLPAGGTFGSPMVAVDPEGQLVTYSIATNPEGVAVNASTGQLYVERCALCQPIPTVCVTACTLLVAFLITVARCVAGFAVWSVITDFPPCFCCAE